MQGRVRIGAEVSATKIESSHPVEPAEYELDPATGAPYPVQAADHEVNLYLADLALTASVGMADWLAVEARLPLRLVKTTATYHDEDGNELPQFESIHHRDETLFGPGDLELVNRFRLVAGSPTLDLRLGLALPTGGIEDNPFALGREGKRHEHTFFGSGTLDPILGLDGTFRVGSFTLATTFTARSALYENPRGYQAGLRVGGAAFLVHGIGASGIQLFGGPALQYEGAAKWDGVADSEGEGVDGGRTDLVAAGGVMFSASEKVSLRALVQKPFTLSSTSEHLNIPLVVGVGGDFTFDAFEPEEEHHHHAGDGHDHGDEHEHADEHDEHARANDAEWLEHLPPARAGADVTDVAKNGETFQLRDALGNQKVTVIDFWAEWCKPCHEIDRALRSLASENPNLVVRRVEVVDFDSDVARQHLRGVKVLPVVWIYDASGKRVETLVGTSARDVYDRVKLRLSPK